VTAKYANHAKKEANWGFPSRIWRISPLSLFASCQRPLLDLCAPLGRFVRNKANSGGWHTPLFYCSIIPPFCAKQTQFADGPKEG
jgi:hypothetical protein